jgi:hypothetical protein
MGLLYLYLYCSNDRHILLFSLFPIVYIAKETRFKEHANSIFRISTIQEEMTLLTYTLKREAEMSSEESVNVYQ